MKMITLKRALAGSLVLNVALVIALAGDGRWVRDSRADTTPTANRCAGSRCEAACLSAADSALKRAPARLRQINR